MDTEIRSKLFQMSSFYYQYALIYETHLYKQYDLYYKAMVDHKLGIIYEQYNCTYLSNSANNFIEVINRLEDGDHDKFVILTKNSFKFLADIYARLINHGKQFGYNDDMLTEDEYDELAAEMQNNSKYP